MEQISAADIIFGINFAKMRKYLDSLFKDDNSTQDEYVDRTIAWHGRRAVLENQNYQTDRSFKQNYILVNVIAEGYDQKRFIEFMVSQKSKCKGKFAMLE